MDSWLVIIFSNLSFDTIDRNGFYKLLFVQVLFFNAVSFGRNSKIQLICGNLYIGRENLHMNPPTGMTQVYWNTLTYNLPAYVENPPRLRDNFIKVHNEDVDEPALTTLPSENILFLKIPPSVLIDFTLTASHDASAIHPHSRSFEVCFDTVVFQGSNRIGVDLFWVTKPDNRINTFLAKFRFSCRPPFRGQTIRKKTKNKNTGRPAAAWRWFSAAPKGAFNRTDAQLLSHI